MISFHGYFKKQLNSPDFYFNENFRQLWFYWRQTQYKALTSVQSSLEAEIKAKQEAIKHKKKLESDLCALEQSIRDSHKTNSDLTSRWQKLGQKVSELESQLLDEQNQKLEANELALASERRANSISTQLDEKATELRLIEKKVASLEMELGEVNERVEELNRFSSALTLQKKKLEAESKKMKGTFDPYSMHSSFSLLNPDL